MCRTVGIKRRAPCSLPALKLCHYVQGFLILRFFVIAADAATTSTRSQILDVQSTQHYPHVIFLLRGGNLAETAEPEPSTDAERKGSGDTVFDIIGSLFQLNNDIKSEAALSNNKKEIADLPNINNRLLSSASANDGRGGAFVKTKPKRFSWLAPLDTNRVAPLSSRLIEEDRVVISHAITIQEPYDNQQASCEATRNTTEALVYGSDTADAIELDQQSDKNDGSESGDASKLTSPFDGKEGLATSSSDSPALETSEVEDTHDVEYDNVETIPLSQDVDQAADDDISPFVSSGYWTIIDKTVTMGLSTSYPSLRLSRKLRSLRKTAARLTGLHGVISGKTETEESDDPTESAVKRRLAAISHARDNLQRAEMAKRQQQRGFLGQFISRDSSYNVALEKNEEQILKAKRRQDRVKEIDRLISESQMRLQELACEKDVLQRRPNPLWNYTSDEEGQNVTSESTFASRMFSFPPQDLVEEYLEVLFASGRLVKLNHTDLWRSNFDEDDDDDELEAYSAKEESQNSRRRVKDRDSSGNWWLRNGLGEKIGETAEKAAYKAVGGAVMGVLARSLSALHGVNVMAYSDIRLFMEQVPDLPPLAAGIIPGSGKSANYARGAIEKAIRGSRKKSKSRRSRSQDDTFIQRDAVVETLLSHCQISAPLLKMFPIAWQRAMLGNIITLITAVVADFFDGIEFNLLGHRLTFSFKPISEADMLRSLGTFAEDSNRHRSSPEEFEAAVKATADDLADGLKFLDRWHERALGGGVLRSQIANLIARLVITLIDDVLSAARMDLWTAFAGGPRLVAALEYRTNPTYMGSAVPAER